jgi:hypothetical protein
VPKVRITEDSLWYDRHYRKGEEVCVEGREYLDLLMAGRIEVGNTEAVPASPVLPGSEIEGRHKGELIFVLGNGPSLLSARDHETQLRAFTTIGVNRAYRLLQTTCLLFLDRSFWAAESREILESGSAVFCPKRLGLPYFTQFGRYRSSHKKDVLSETWADGLYWSRSSGVAAVNLAYLFGAAEIALLGIDLRDSSHFYSERGRGRPFLHADRILEDLWWISRALVRKGLKLWNCSEESAVRGFEKAALQALLKRR